MSKLLADLVQGSGLLALAWNWWIAIILVAVIVILLVVKKKQQ